MRFSLPFIVAGLAASLSWPGAPAVAQDSFDAPRSTRVLEFPNLGPIPGGSGPSFGPPPGALNTDMTTADPNMIGGRRRTSILPRGVRGTGRPAATAELPPPSAAVTSPTIESRAVPTMAIDTSLPEDEGPPEGLTLDDAIDRMLASNLDIRAIRHELPQADADILTAGLRTNPLIYVDTQFIPYGAFNDRSPGGPTQYDVNLTLPMDVSQKRRARVVVARLAKSTLEAQFQDLVRRHVDAVCRAFVNLHAARLEVLAAGDAVARCERLLANARATPASPDAEATVERLSLTLERARLAAIEADEAFADSQESIGVLLNEPAHHVPMLQPRGTLKDTAAPPPPADDLVHLALECRPDLLAVRRGVQRARAEVDLQQANAFDDIYLFYDPITVQDFGPYGRQDASSWAVGLTVSVPLFNRNQGNVARARTNVCQTRNELTAAERRVESEVRLADREYRTSRRALERIEQGLLPLAASTLRRQVEAFSRGAVDVESLENAAEEAATVAQNHRLAVCRHRRSMLELNTAVGLRLLP
jgi:cobalt-zinc-cadmium efflux system outer membrane protein